MGEGRWKMGYGKGGGCGIGSSDPIEKHVLSRFSGIVL